MGEEQAPPACRRPQLFVILDALRDSDTERQGEIGHKWEKMKGRP